MELEEIMKELDHRLRTAVAQLDKTSKSIIIEDFSADKASTMLQNTASIKVYSELRQALKNDNGPKTVSEFYNFVVRRLCSYAGSPMNSTSIEHNLLKAYCAAELANYLENNQIRGDTCP